MPHIIGLAGFVISLTAVWLQWNLSHQISRLEDKLKDGRLDSASVGRRIRWAQLMPMLCTLAGAGLLLIAAFRLVR
ncbi:MAG: hypothetical protein K9M98_08815 [Cephaloticoccus sp.]|nr:hypothetical protein [Cephaloticoccus sp.]MCF7760592.1 hypothetical protein [Cephaloticoccus sp.]